MPLNPGQLANRPLHFIWICDCSGSMSGQKIESLNYAINNAIPLMQQEAEKNANAQVLVRAIKFSSGAQWHIAEPTPIESFSWIPLTADGVTDMGKALAMVSEQLKMPPMTDRALPPVLVLISDGQPTDDFSSGLKKLMEQLWGQKAVRIAIAVGTDVDYEPLQKFIGHSELKPLQANNPESLVKQIKWVSTAVISAVSAPINGSKDNSGGTFVPIPQPPSPIDNTVDVW
jgi:uncharacterized protein YegL